MNFIFVPSLSKTNTFSPKEQFQTKYDLSAYKVHPNVNQNKIYLALKNGKAELIDDLQGLMEEDNELTEFIEKYYSKSGGQFTKEDHSNLTYLISEFLNTYSNFVSSVIQPDKQDLYKVPSQVPQVNSIINMINNPSEFEGFKSEDGNPKILESNLAIIKFLMDLQMISNTINIELYTRSEETVSKMLKLFENENETTQNFKNEIRFSENLKNLSKISSQEILQSLLFKDYLKELVNISQKNLPMYRLAKLGMGVKVLTKNVPYFPYIIDLLATDTKQLVLPVLLKRTYVDSDIDTSRLQTKKDYLRRYFDEIIVSDYKH